MPNNFNNATVRNVGTAITMVGVAVPNGMQVTAIGLVLCNTSANAISVDATVYDGANDTYMVKGVTIPAGSSLGIIGGDQKVVLKAGQSIRVRSSAATSLDAVLSTLEIT